MNKEILSTKQIEYSYFERIICIAFEECFGRYFPLADCVFVLLYYFPFDDTFKFIQINGLLKCIKVSSVLILKSCNFFAHFITFSNNIYLLKALKILVHLYLYYWLTFPWRGPKAIRLIPNSINRYQSFWFRRV